jgi:hypothetical protein
VRGWTLLDRAQESRQALRVSILSARPVFDAVLSLESAAAESDLDTARSRLANVEHALLRLGETLTSLIAAPNELAPAAPSTLV